MLGTVFIIVIIVASVIIHEVAHGYAADWLGDPTARLAGRLTLNPLKHADPFGSIIVPLLLALAPGGLIFGWAKPVPYNPFNLKAGQWGPSLVAAAGPAANILLALIFSFFIRFLPVIGFSLSPAALSLSITIVLLNISLAIFNLVPIPPLDGSKILFALLPYRYRDWETTLTHYSWIFLLLLIFVFWNFLSALVFALTFLLTGSALLV